MTGFASSLNDYDDEEEEDEEEEDDYLMQDIDLDEIKANAKPRPRIYKAEFFEVAD